MILGDAIRAEIDELATRYPERRGALLPALHLVEREHGHISPDATRELADLFGLRPNEVLAVVSFYEMFGTEPRGRHRAGVCTNLPCSLRGARTLLAQLELHLGVRAGETTDDGRLTLGREECLGACAAAPMMRVDEVDHEHLDFEKASAILDGLE
ncbi:MAG: NAD(P)H-dependent oxidoreductase subunit E [Myxococcota bacterium]|nr:NAD(P)H-dependent oxidoreductase subunit E [Myxococcota bacterium]